MFKRIFVAGTICSALTLTLVAQAIPSGNQHPVQNQVSTPQHLPAPTAVTQPTVAPIESITPEIVDGSAIQVAILLDTSSSMDGLINQTRTELWSVINALGDATKNGKRPILQVALYEYGQSTISEEEGQLRMVSAFTSDLDHLSESLFSLRTNGGNEYSGAVIQNATNGLLWTPSENDLKVIFIAGNESFSQGNVPFQESIAKARSEGIIVNTIHCGTRAQGVAMGWQQGAEIGNGGFFSIDQNQVVAYVEAPQDAEITKLNTALNNSYVPYGANGGRGMERQQIQDRNSNINIKGFINRSLSKASSYYNNEEWDLVDAYENRRIDLRSLSSSDLPADLRGKSPEEMQSYIEGKKAERETIQKRMAELKRERAQYLSSLPNDSDQETLEDAIIGTLRIQAEKKDFVL